MELSNNIYLVTGIPGAGKSSILDEAIKELPDHKLVSFGTMMLDVCVANNLVEDRDKMRTLPLSTQREIQERVAKNIALMEGNVVVDTHLTIKTPDGYMPGVPIWILDIMKPKVLILVDSHEVEIRGRRKQDATKGRGRDLESFDDIQEHKAFNRSYAAAYSVLSGATVVVIMNYNGEYDRAVTEMKHALSIYSKKKEA